MNLPTRACRVCGNEKTVCAFQPNRWKAKPEPVCNACIVAYRRNRRVGNPVPADMNFNAKEGQR